MKAFMVCTALATYHARVVDFDDIEEAGVRLSGVAHRTPLLRSRLLSTACGGTVLLKAENQQRGGAFKFRGAFNAVAKSLDRARASGVITGSSGNHGQALALAAGLLGVRAIIAMPTDAAGVKVAAVRDYGAEVVLVGRTSEERLGYAAERAQRDGMLSIPPYDHEDVIAGQGTCGAEIFAEMRPDVVLVPTGGGGLFAGTCLSAAALSPSTEVWGVETEAACDTWKSFREGQRVRIDLPDTIADGMRNLEPGKLTFPIVKQHARGVILVTDEAVREAMRFVMTRMKLVVEPTGATGIAALMSGRFDLAGRTAVVIVSGGNVDPKTYAAILAG